MPPAEVTDGSVEEFSAGMVDEGAYVARTGNGEVLLQPKVVGEFGGDSLPEGWTVTPWAEGGTGTLSGGMLLLDGARVGYQPLLQSPRSLEFSAVFASRPDQHVGFGTNFVDVPWVMFSTKWGRRLYGRTHLLMVEDTRLAGDWFDRPHRFRIDWNVIDIVFSIDGQALGRVLVPVPGVMRPLAGNQRQGGPPLAVEWMRVSPYAPAGRFTSRVLDAGGPARWRGATWAADVPEATSLHMHVRTGDVAVPDGTWSEWRPVAEPGADVGATGRFLQYRADLATADAGRTPVLRSVSVAYSPAGAGESSRSSGSGSVLGCQ